jgi:uncharacterized protein involved in exopolysaccharide biosynthesis
MQDSFYMQEEENEDSSFINFRKYLRYWKWFVLSVIICLSIAFVKLRYSTPQYKATSKILVRDEKKGDLPSELGAFSDLGLLGGVKNNVDNEVEILNSLTLVEKTVERLHYNVTYFRQGKIRDVEVYRDTQPIEMLVSNASDAFNKSSQSFIVKIISKNSFELELKSGQIMGVFQFGTPILVKEAQISIQKLPVFNSIDPVGDLYTINFSPIIAVGASYSSLLTVESLSKTSSIVNLSMTNAVPKKAEEFLDGLITIYNEEAIKDKNMISENTLKFIQERLDIISKELGNEEDKAKGFKESNKLVDVGTNAKMYLDNFSDVDKMLIETETKLRVIEIMLDFMKHKSKSELVPAELIPSERISAQVNPLILQYNSLVLQNNRLLKDGKKNNATLVNIDQQLTDMERDILQSLAQYKAKLAIEKTELNQQYNLLSGKLNQIPAQEQQYRVIERQQKIKEGIYLYLIQKREETAISLSVTEPNAKIVDAGRAGVEPISPKKIIFYLVAILLGFGVPFGILYVIFLLDNKIHNTSDLEDKAKGVPILAEIPFDNNDEKGESIKIEAFRTLVSNANFITPYDENVLALPVLVVPVIKLK